MSRREFEKIAEVSEENCHVYTNESAIVHQQRHISGGKTMLTEKTASFEVFAQMKYTFG